MTQKSDEPSSDETVQSPSWPARAVAPATLTIDLARLQDNWRVLRDRVAPSACGAVIKADAYGLGIEPVVCALRRAGCSMFFVAHPQEGLTARGALRAAQLDGDICVLNGFAGMRSAAEACADADLFPMIGESADAEIWAETAQRRNKRLPIALMFDTGMNRLGYDWRRAASVARAFVSEARLSVSFIASHLVASEESADAHNDIQIERFADVRGHFPNSKASLCNSSGVFLPQSPHLDLVRPGYALYGGNPTPRGANPMKPVVRLVARILQLREIEAGETVGYNAQWTAKRTTCLAAIGVGYADGLPRNAMTTDWKQGAHAIVANAACPFAGRVSMDLITIDVTDVASRDLQVGALVELLGDTITVDDLGGSAQTIGYEILTNLGRRYRREYVGGEL